MTTTSSQGGRRVGPVLRVAGCVSGDLFFYTLIWTGLVLGITALNLLINVVFGEVDRSLWVGGSTWPRYGVLAAGIMLAYSYPPLYVSHGITRSRFAAGTGLAGAALVLAIATLGTGGFWLEGVLYRAAGWPQTIDLTRIEATAYLFDRPDQYGLIWLALLVGFGSHLVSGWLIGASYYRYGGLAGTVLLPLTVLPAVGPEMALGAGWIGASLNEALGYTPLPQGGGLAVAAGFAVLGLAAAAAIVRTMPIDGQQVIWWR